MHSTISSRLKNWTFIYFVVCLPFPFVTVFFLIHKKPIITKDMIVLCLLYIIYSIIYSNLPISDMTISHWLMKIKHSTKTRLLQQNILKLTSDIKHAPPWIKLSRVKNKVSATKKGSDKNCAMWQENWHLFNYNHRAYVVVCMWLVQNACVGKMLSEVNCTLFRETHFGSFG